VGIAYEEDIEKAEKVIRDLLEKMPEKYEELVREPDFLGIQNFGPSEVTVRIVAETLPMQHNAVSRKIRKDIKLALDENGIEIPYPRMVMYSKDNGNIKEPSV
jgi:small conductance mechanosensitive channel